MSSERNRAENETAREGFNWSPLPLAESVGLCEDGDVGRVVSECPQYFLKTTLLTHAHIFWDREIKKRGRELSSA